MQSSTKRIVVVMMVSTVAVLALCVGGFGIKARGQGTKETKAAMPAAQVIACITTAVAAKPGNVLGVEAENEGGTTICEVEILAQDGKTYEVAVDVATNMVIEVEANDEDDNDEKD